MKLSRYLREHWHFKVKRNHRLKSDVLGSSNGPSVGDEPKCLAWVCFWVFYWELQTIGDLQHDIYIWAILDDGSPKTPQIKHRWTITWRVWSRENAGVSTEEWQWVVANPALLVGVFQWNHSADPWGWRLMPCFLRRPHPDVFKHEAKQHMGKSENGVYYKTADLMETQW